MRLLLCSVLVLTSACALLNRQGSGVSASTTSRAATAAVLDVPPSATEGATTPEATAAAEADVPDDDGEDGEDSDEASAVEEEGESHDLPGEDGNRLRYTLDLSDEALEQSWKATPEQLGSISLGFVDEGRLINAQRFPSGPDWIVVSPDRAYATTETLEYVATAIRAVRAQYPEAPPLRVNQMSSKDGGYLRPHKSHQNGRDVDLGFYYPTVDPIRVRAREKHIDVAKNWALIKALVMHTDVQFILVDNRVQKVIYDHALKAGEDPQWLASLFKAGKDSIVKHARRHRDHFHVRFYNARAQELGRRVAPLLAQRPEQNIAFHRVRSGDTLGAIARKYGTSVTMIQKTNRMRGSFLRLAQQLRIPLRGPCTRCPVPPAVVVPDRRLPPLFEEATPTGVVEAAVSPSIAPSLDNGLVPTGLGEPAAWSAPSAISANNVQ